MKKSSRFLKKIRQQNGFTLIELMIVLGISATLFGLIIFDLVRFQNTNSQQSSSDSLVSDIRTQQFKAMFASTEGRADTDDYGIYFYSDRYVLFHGSSFNPSDPSNFTVELPEDLEIQSTSFPDNTIIFEKISGEILGYIPGANSLVLRAIRVNRDFTITLNRYGVITRIN
jgi:prepilin-type N-terminal cleavage/methylation domain-containing protein